MIVVRLVAAMSPHKTTQQLSDVAEQYFSNINPIATRIYADFKDTRNAYERIWNTLSTEEQTQILNESIIKPEITLKYSVVEHAGATPDTKQRTFAQKRVLDEQFSYRDEHSAPFTFKTMSQVDLRLFASEPVTNRAVISPKFETPAIISSATIEMPVAVRYKSDTSIFGKLLGRKQRPPDAEQEVLVSPDSLGGSDAGGSLPKTGLDFLDNW